MGSLIVVCLLNVVTCGKIPFFVDAEIDGKIIKENGYNYYVDFSESENIKKYCSKLKKKIVPKKKCIRL